VLFFYEQGTPVVGRGMVLQLLHNNMQPFRGGLVFMTHRIFVSLNSRLESNKEEEEEGAVSHQNLRPGVVMNAIDSEQRVWGYNPV